MPPDQGRQEIFSWMKAHTGLLLINGEANLDFPRPFHHSVMFLGDLGKKAAPTSSKSPSSKLVSWSLH